MTGIPAVFAGGNRIGFVTCASRVTKRRPPVFRTRRHAASSVVPPVHHRLEDQEGDRPRFPRPRTCSVLRTTVSRRTEERGDSSIDISTVATVDHEDQELLLTDDIQDSVGSHPERVAALQLAFQGLALNGVTSQVIQGLGDPSVQSRFPSGHAPDDAFGLIGELDPISGQGTP